MRGLGRDHVKLCHIWPGKDCHDDGELVHGHGPQEAVKIIIDS